MSGKRSYQVKTILCVACALSALWAGVASGAPPLRYALAPGQRFDLAAPAAGAANSLPDNWTVWVIEPVGDGWRLLVRRRNHWDSVATVLLSNRGELSDWLPRDSDLALEEIIPVLPPDDDASPTHWRSGGWLPMEWRLVDPPNEKSAAPGITIEGKLADSLGKAFSRERTTTWRLDPARGLFPVQIVFTHVPADGSAPDVRRLDLERAEQMPAEETAALAAQARDFCALHDAYLRALDGAVEPSADAESQLAEAWTDLALARNRIRSEVRGPLDSLLLRHHGRVKELREHARLVAELRARTPADWTADDTSGKTHRAADYRGQIVVLDFWFAACGPCLRAVPTIKRLRQAFPADQVAILGANVDDDPGEARWVVERAGIEYPTLLARALADEYGVSSYPTFVILGRDGRVREKFVAEGRALHEKLDSTLRRLLAGPPEGASDRTLPSSP